MVTSIDQTREVWQFDCARCGESWRAEYRKRRAIDGSGPSWEYVDTGGAPVASPQVPPVCRACGYVFVRSRLTA